MHPRQLQLATAAAAGAALLLLQLLCGAEASGGFCLSGISAAEDDGTTWAQGSRPLPPPRPPLAAHDWELGARAVQAQLSGQSYVRCHADAPILRFKLVTQDGRRLLFGDDAAAGGGGAYQQYAHVFLEQLVLAVWLFRDFPDVDLVVDLSDHPQLCAAGDTIPFLRFSIFNASAGGLDSARGGRYNVTDLLSPGWVTREALAQLQAQAAPSTSSLPAAAAAAAATASAGAGSLPALPYTRGFTISSPEAWRELALSKAQLRQYTACLDETHPWASKRRVVFWRGAATGCSRGWRAGLPGGGAAGATQQQQQHQQAQHGAGPHLLRNKRVQAVLRAFAQPHLFDMGLTGLPSLTPECLGASSSSSSSGSSSGSSEADGEPPGARAAGRRARAALSRTAHAGRARAYRAVAQLLRKEAIGLEGWADAVATCSIDGYGPPYRLPQQLLLGSAVLRMASPYQTWLDSQVVPGRHVAQFAYDLADFEAQAHALLYDGGSDGGGGSSMARLQRMAADARALVAGRVSVLAQLDSFAWSVARFKAACDWAVELPAPGDGTWRLLTLDAGLFNARGVPERVQRDAMRHMGANFKAVVSSG